MVFWAWTQRSTRCFVKVHLWEPKKNTLFVKNSETWEKCTYLIFFLCEYADNRYNLILLGPHWVQRASNCAHKISVNLFMERLHLFPVAAWIKQQQSLGTVLVLLHPHNRATVAYSTRELRLLMARLRCKPQVVTSPWTAWRCQLDKDLRQENHEIVSLLRRKTHIYSSLCGQIFMLSLFPNGQCKMIEKGLWNGILYSRAFCVKDASKTQNPTCRSRFHPPAVAVMTRNVHQINPSRPRKTSRFLCCPSARFFSTVTEEWESRASFLSLSRSSKQIKSIVGFQSQFPVLCKAPFTQDAEHLATCACKLWNTL